MPPSNKSQTFTLSFQLSTLTFLWVPFVFWGGRFSQNEEQKNNRSHNNLNTTDDSMGLTESFSPSTELCDACAEIKSFCYGN
jgi:hypothetical protein